MPEAPPVTSAVFPLRWALIMAGPPGLVADPRDCFVATLLAMTMKELSLRGAARHEAISIRIGSEVKRLAEADQRRLSDRLAQGRVHVDRGREVVEQGAHCQRMRKLAGQLGHMPPDRLDAEHPAILSIGNDADKAAPLPTFQGQCPAAGGERKLR